MKSVAIIRDPLYREHSNGAGHPENPQRLEAIDEMLARFPLKSHLVEIAARDAGIEELGRVHRLPYIQRIEKTREHNFTMLDPDTGATESSYAAALRAAGGAMAAVDAVLDRDLGGAFAFVRPPGHHAEAAQAMGFCLFNNIAVAALHAIVKRGLERVLIVDWDVHHGNGTMHSFYDSDQVLFCSVHQYPHYPGTGLVQDVGRGAGEGYSVNVPLPGGQGDAEYMQIFRRVFQPIADAYRPRLILISAGFDAHEFDPLAAIDLSSRAYWDMTAVLREIADECCPGGLVALLEGGYSLAALSEGVAQVLTALIGAESELQPQPDGDASEFIEPVIAVQKAYWQVF